MINRSPKLPSIHQGDPEKLKRNETASSHRPPDLGSATPRDQWRWSDSWRSEPRCSTCSAAGGGPASPRFYRPGRGEPLGMNLGPDPQPECFLLSKSLPCATISRRPEAAAQSQESFAIKCKSPSTELQGWLSHAWVGASRLILPLFCIPTVLPPFLHFFFFFFCLC